MEGLSTEQDGSARSSGFLSLSLSLSLTTSGLKGGMTGVVVGGTGQLPVPPEAEKQQPRR